MNKNTLNQMFEDIKRLSPKAKRAILREVSIQQECDKVDAIAKAKREEQMKLDVIRQVIAEG